MGAHLAVTLGETWRRPQSLRKAGQEWPGKCFAARGGIRLNRHGMRARFDSSRVATEKRGQQLIVLMIVVQLAIRFWWQWRVFICSPRGSMTASRKSPRAKEARVLSTTATRLQSDPNARTLAHPTGIRALYVVRPSTRGTLATLTIR